MEQADSFEHYQAFYNQWAPLIFGYCRLFIGDVRSAEEATAESFSDYFQRFRGSSNSIALKWLPIALLIQAVHSCWLRGIPAGTSIDCSSFARAVHSLAPSAREVFIIPGALHIRLPETAAATGLSISGVEHLWIASLFRVRTIWLKKGELAGLTERCLSNVRELLLQHGRQI